MVYSQSYMLVIDFKLLLMKIRIRLSSILDMLDSFFGQFEFSNGCRNQILHLLSSTEDSDGLLVLVRIDLDLINQFFIYHLELRYYRQQSIQLTVQSFVVVQTQKMLFSQSFLLSHDEVELVLLGSYISFSCCQFRLKFFASGYLVTEIG